MKDHQQFWRYALESLAALSVFSSSLFAISAERFPGESYLEARNRNLPEVWSTSANQTAEQASVSWDTLDTSKLPTIAKSDEMFEYIRDTRFLFMPSDPTFERRVSWLYPQDGCWTRAAVARHMAHKKGYGELQKLFIFGSLYVKTSNAPGGSVSWWYHVVAAFKDAAGKARVVDPAIDPTGPMLLADWVKTMVRDPKSARFSLCSSATFHPGDFCEQTNDRSDETAESDQEAYLDYEWDNLLNLGRDPKEELGDLPPWNHPIPVSHASVRLKR